MALGFAPRSALANTAVLVTPTPPAGWGVMRCGAAAWPELLTLCILLQIPLFLPPSLSLSLRLHQASLSFSASFAEEKMWGWFWFLFWGGGWKSRGTRLEVGDPKWRRCSALAAEGKRIESQQPASVPASNSMFSETPHFFFTIYSDFLFLFPALCLLFIPIRPFLSRCCALLLPCFARSSLLRTPGRQDPQCATNTPRPPPKIPPQRPKSQHLGTPAPKSLL